MQRLSRSHAPPPRSWHACSSSCGCGTQATQHHPDVAIYSYDGRNDWVDFAGMHNLDALDDARIVSRKATVPISTAHAEGLFHRGLWLAVARRQRHMATRSCSCTAQ